MMETNVKALDTTGILKRLERFLDSVWKEEPEDVRKLRRHALPPMGNLPCVLYANFNTFWIGENVQVHRLLALEKKVGLTELNATLAAILTRHAARLAKWEMRDTVELVEELVAYFAGQGPRSYEEFVQVAESVMVTLDRVNGWIDAMIPWSKMDAALGGGN